MFKNWMRICMINERDICIAWNVKLFVCGSVSLCSDSVLLAGPDPAVFLFSMVAGISQITGSLAGSRDPYPLHRKTSAYLNAFVYLWLNLRMCCIFIFDRAYGNAYTEKHECLYSDYGPVYIDIYIRWDAWCYILHALQVDHSCMNRGNSAGIFMTCVYVYVICYCIREIVSAHRMKKIYIYIWTATASGRYLSSYVW